MLPTQRIDPADYCQAAQAWTMLATGRSRSPEPRLLSQVLALPSSGIYRTGQQVGKGWHDLLCEQLIAGLWRERYRLPVLACYVPTQPLRVYLCCQSPRATFVKVYKRLHAEIGVEDSGSGYLHADARPVVLWQPPATMVRLWPPPDRSLRRDQRYAVDAGNLAGYYSYPYERSDMETIASRPLDYADYAVVPEQEHAVYRDGKDEYPYTNRFYVPGDDEGNLEETLDGDEMAEYEDFAKDVFEAWRREHP